IPRTTILVLPRSTSTSFRPWWCATVKRTLGTRRRHPSMRRILLIRLAPPRHHPVVPALRARGRRAEGEVRTAARSGRHRACLFPNLLSRPCVHPLSAPSKRVRRATRRPPPIVLGPPPRHGDLSHTNLNH